MARFGVSLGGVIKVCLFFLTPILKVYPADYSSEKINNWKYFIWAKSYKNECQWISQIA